MEREQILIEKLFGQLLLLLLAFVVVITSLIMYSLFEGRGSSIFINPNGVVMEEDQPVQFTRGFYNGNTSLYPVKSGKQSGRTEADVQQIGNSDIPNGTVNKIYETRHNSNGRLLQLQIKS